MNIFTIVGRLYKEPRQIEKTRYFEIVVAVNRQFRNEYGLYETDFIPILVDIRINSTFIEYCFKGDIVAIKGRIEKEANGELKMIAEKITFLAKGSDKQCNN